MVFRHILGALAGSDHAEAAGAGPVDKFADQGGLIAIGHGVDGAGLGGLAGQQRTCEDIGLHVDHDDVLAFADRATSMRDSGGGVAGGFDDDFHIGGCHHGHGVIGEAGGRDPCFVPTDPAAGLAGAVRGQVGDGGDFQARGGGDL